LARTGPWNGTRGPWRALFLSPPRADGQLVGLIRLVGDGAYILHVAGLSVHPDFQRQGIGRRLVKLAIDFCRETQVGSGRGPGEFTLFSNTGANRFYKKLGFTLIPNGMVLTETAFRRRLELRFQKEWQQRRDNG